MKQVVDVTLIGAMGPPGGGRQIMSNRMVRHLHMLTFADLATRRSRSSSRPSPARSCAPSSVTSSTGLAKPIVQATLNLYTAALGSLKPTPEKPHYTFNLRDISKIIQGVCMADKRRGREKEDICRLWTHEACRVFADRLINDTDRKWFMGEIKEQCKERFKLQYPKLVCPGGRQAHVLRLPRLRPTRPSTRR